MFVEMFDAFVKMFTETPLAEMTGLQLVILMAFSFYVPIKFTNAMHIIGTLRSGGDTLFAFFAEVVALWGIGVPLAFILSIFTSLPLHIIVAIVNVEELIKFVLVNTRFFTYKWANNLTN